MHFNKSSLELSQQEHKFWKSINWGVIFVIIFFKWPFAEENKAAVS